MSNNLLPGKIKRFSESGNSRTEKVLTSPSLLMRKLSLIEVSGKALGHKTGQ